MDFKTSNGDDSQIESGLEHEKAPANKLVVSLLGVMVVFLLVMGVMIFNNLKGDSLKTNIVDEKQQMQQKQDLGPTKTNEEVAPLSQEEIDALLNNPAAEGDMGDAAQEEVAPLSQEEIDSLLNNPVAAPETETATDGTDQTQSVPAETVAPLSQEEIDALLNNPVAQ